MNENIYTSEYVEELFDKMSGTYESMNYVTSFGFSHRWRKQFLQDLKITKGQVVVDLMTGMGECWKPILNQIGEKGNLIALDFSEGMLSHARKRLTKWRNYDITTLKENVFQNTINRNLQIL